ncbi:MAG: hypothetical protein RL148_2664 [Planctomycetota bacterium]|jgi:hypothetical protein
MGFRTTLVLLLVAAVLGTVLWLTPDRVPDQPVLDAPLLEGRTLADAKSIRWQLADQPMVELQRREDGGFQLTEPLVDLASRARVAAVAAAYDTARILPAREGAAADAGFLAQAGLDKPRAWFEAGWPDGSKVRIELGEPGSLGSDIFLRRGSTIHQGSVALRSTLEVGLEDLRERQVFANHPLAVSSVRVDRLMESGAREVMELKRVDSGWRMEQPISTRVEPQATQSFLAQLLGLRIDQFPASVMRLPERDPDIRVHVEGGFGPEQVDLWRDTSGYLLGRLDSRKIRFASSDLQLQAVFEDAVGRLRARWLVPVVNPTEQLLRVVVDWGTAGPPRLVLARESVQSQWMVVEPVSALVDPTALAELVQAVNNCRVLEFLPGGSAEPRYGIGPGSVRVTVFALEQKQPAVLVLGGSGTLGEAAVAYCARDDEMDQVVAVPGPVADLMRREWRAYVSRDALRLDVPVGRVETRRGDQLRVFELRNGKWYRDPDAIPVAELPDLVDELRDLRGERVDGARLLKLGEPDWTVALCRGNGDQLVVLRVWDRGPTAPLLVQPNSQPELVYELSPYLSGYVRVLWR